MSVQTPNGPITAENADNFEDIEKQFAVKGKQPNNEHCDQSVHVLTMIRSRPAHDNILVHPREAPRL